MLTDTIKLREFRKANSLTQDELAAYLGVTKGFISQIENGKVALPEDKLRKIRENSHWATDILSTLIQEKSQKQESHRVYLLPQEARGGTLGDFASGVMAYQCEKIISPILGVDLAMTVTGDSMSPEYPSGSTVLLKRINEEAFIEWGRVYVLDTDNGAVIKQIRKTDTPNEVECISLNPGYQPFRIKTEFIKGWYRVLMVMSAK